MYQVSTEPVLAIEISVPDQPFSSPLWVSSAAGYPVGDAILDNPEDFAEVVRAFVQAKTGQTPTLNAITRYHNVSGIYP